MNISSNATLIPGVPNAVAERQVDLNWLGAIMAVASSTFTNLGVVVQKDSHNREEMRPEHQRRPSYKRPRWWVGLFCVVFGALLDFAALGLASQLLIAVVGGASTIIASLVFATLWLKDNILRTDVAGVSIITGAVVLAAIAAPVDATCAPEHLEAMQITCLDMLESLFKEAAFIVYLLAMAGMTAALCFSLRRNPRSTRAPSFYGLLSGVLGSMSVLLAKCLSEVIHELAIGESWVMGRFESWCFILGTVFFAVTQTWTLNAGIQVGDTLSVLPYFQTSWLGFSAAGGIVFYQEGNQLVAHSGRGAILYALAFLLTIGGIFLLSKHGADPVNSAHAHKFNKMASQGHFINLPELMPDFTMPHAATTMHAVVKFKSLSRNNSAASVDPADADAQTGSARAMRGSMTRVGQAVAVEGSSV